MRRVTKSKPKREAAEAMPEAKARLTKIYEKLVYKFRKPELLELALIHKSFGNENRSTQRVGVRDNERLEFLGDAILDFIVSQILIETFPHSTEGELSKRRASL